jgi:Flp pilus assembly protein TadG
MIRRAVAQLRRFRDDRRGVSAVEFALLAPVIIVTYLGMAELSQGFLAKRRVEHAASTIADLTSQNRTVNDAKVADIFSAGAMMLSPMPTTTLTQRITSVTVNSSGVANVDWSTAKNIAVRTSATLPAGVANKGETVIMGEVGYDYQSGVGMLLKHSVHLSATYYLRPRLSDQIAKTTN